MEYNVFTGMEAMLKLYILLVLQSLGGRLLIHMENLCQIVRKMYMPLNT